MDDYHGHSCQHAGEHRHSHGHFQRKAITAAFFITAGFGIRHSVFLVESEPVENSSCDICA